MKILFFTLIKITSLKNSSIYSDMIKEFIKIGHHVDYYFPHETKINFLEKNCSFTSIPLKIKAEKTNNFLLKFLSYKIIEKKFSQLIYKSKVDYDLLILVTPSIFQIKIIKAFKKRFPLSKSLLLLKDIFPDNAVDLGILKNTFPFNLLILYFKNIELDFYNNFDFIGVMSDLNQKYLIKKYPHLKSKIFISPNSLKYYKIITHKGKKELGIPENKIIVTFVGNIGLPQNPLLLKKIINESPNDLFFIIIGKGSQEKVLQNISTQKLLYINYIVDQGFIDQYLVNSNFGLVILNSRFKVPNFPSKILSYLNANLPLICLTNFNNDLRYLIKNGKIPGIWFDSSNFTYQKLFHSISTFTNKKKFKRNIYKVSTQISDIIKLLNNNK